MFKPCLTCCLAGAVLLGLPCLGSAAPIVPTNGLVVHLQADQALVDASGKVTQWTDQSGLGNFAEPVVSAGGPLQVTEGGKQYIRFATTSDQRLQLPEVQTLGMNSGGYEVFVVAKNNASSAQFLIAGATKEHYEAHLGPSQALRYIPAGYNASDPQTYIDTGAYGTYRNTLTAYNVRVDAAGTAYAAINALQDPKTLLNKQSATTGTLYLGGRGDAGNRLAGDMAEVLIFNRTLNFNERVDVLDYLNVTWGTPLNFVTNVEIGGTFGPHNVGAASAGAIPFASSAHSDTRHQITHLNDGVYGNSKSWLPADDPNNTTAFAGVALDRAYTVSAMAFGRDNTGVYTDRTRGDYEIQYTTYSGLVDAGLADENWHTISRFSYTGATNDAKRHLYEFDPISGVTGMRLFVDYTREGAYDQGWRVIIDEFEVYLVPEPSALVLLVMASVGLLLYRRRR